MMWRLIKMNDLTIINYLTYLKEVSHKIGFSLGLENLFYKKKNKKLKL